MQDVEGLVDEQDEVDVEEFRYCHQATRVGRRLDGDGEFGLDTPRPAQDGLIPGGVSCVVRTSLSEALV